MSGKNGKKDANKEAMLDKKVEKKEVINIKKKIPKDKMFIELPEDDLGVRGTSFNNHLFELTQSLSSNAQE